jgi:sugar lactone lactonase YvrE
MPVVHERRPGSRVLKGLVLPLALGLCAACARKEPVATQASLGGTFEDIVGDAHVEKVVDGFQSAEGPVWVPNGTKADVHGSVFCTGPGGTWVVAPSGEVLGMTKVPEVPAKLAWGDDDLETLYMTAHTGLYRIRLRTGGAPLVEARP